MAIVAVFEVSGMTRDQYEQSTDRVTGGRGPVTKSDDWPVPGLISHTSAPMPDGWLVVDVWESEEAFQRFGEFIIPVLRELGAPEVTPKIYPVHTVVTR